jgi:peptidoglycan/xylan/chitin deacetylase (PgdA/CDA1 family)
MKAIMYHYVRPHDPRIPHLKHLHFEDFCKQLDYFEQEFGFVSKEDFAESLKTGKPVAGVILTFDDGLKCHYSHVYKELRKRNLWGIFYVPTGMYKAKKIIDVHRIHILLGVVDSLTIYNQLISIVSDDMLSDAGKSEFHDQTYTVQQNDNHTLLVKRILNYFISYDHREEVIDALMDLNNLCDVDNYERFYINADEIREMHDNGMIIGSHTENHPVLSKLSPEAQRSEIVNSFDFLEEICGKSDMKTFCYPYGGFHSFDDFTEEILTENGCLFSFNVEQRDITENDLLQRPQALPRYDCNFFRFGKVRI